MIAPETEGEGAIRGHAHGTPIQRKPRARRRLADHEPTLREATVGEGHGGSGAGQQQGGEREQCAAVEHGGALPLRTTPPRAERPFDPVTFIGDVGEGARGPASRRTRNRPLPDIPDQILVSRGP
ncbi:hypothetical protein Rmf_02690 [Roseomonas fluvialis]|uniref:Uncharacterized protein n=1 Tax=Roseomonas fluvialis TaxID=1750527 RepID=A0ABN6NYW5_9PROT|nr:hypothetical protein Rmf_02690 [Roseomonas fluvialis]